MCVFLRAKFVVSSIILTRFYTGRDGGEVIPPTPTHTHTDTHAPLKKPLKKSTLIRFNALESRIFPNGRQTLGKRRPSILARAAKVYRENEITKKNITKN